jgi:hypothetical protein
LKIFEGGKIILGSLYKSCIPVIMLACACWEYLYWTAIHTIYNCSNISTKSRSGLIMEESKKP